MRWSARCSRCSARSPTSSRWPGQRVRAGARRPRRADPRGRRRHRHRRPALRGRLHRGAAPGRRGHADRLRAGSRTSPGPSTPSRPRPTSTAATPTSPRAGSSWSTGAVSTRRAPTGCSSWRWLVGEGERDIARLQRTDPTDPTLPARTDGQAELRPPWPTARPSWPTPARSSRTASGATPTGPPRPRGTAYAWSARTAPPPWCRCASTPACRRSRPTTWRWCRRPGSSVADAGIDVDYGQEWCSSTEVGGIGEAIGVGVAAVVLMVMLGSLVMAGMPLAVAFTGVGVSLLGALALTHWLDLQQMAPVLGVMLGLAVGIDYSLFIVNRHRRQLADLAHAGHDIDREESGTASAVPRVPSGTAVVAGVTVVIALAALRSPGFRCWCRWASWPRATVPVTVLVALTLTPALLSLSPGAGRAASYDAAPSPAGTAGRRSGATPSPDTPGWPCSPASWCWAPWRCPRRTAAGPARRQLRTCRFHGVPGLYPAGQELRRRHQRTTHRGRGPARGAGRHRTGPDAAQRSSGTARDGPRHRRHPGRTPARTAAPRCCRWCPTAARPPRAPRTWSTRCGPKPARSRPPTGVEGVAVTGQTGHAD